MSTYKTLRIAGQLYRYVVLTVFAGLCIFPLLWIALTSLKPDVGEFNYDMSLNFTPTIVNFADVLTRDAYRYYLLNSAIIGVGVVMVTLPIGAMAGYAMARFRFRGKDNFFFFVLSTRMGPPVTIAVPLFLLMLGADLIDTKGGMVLVYVFMNLGLCIWMCRGFFEDMPRDVEEAAMLDGLDHWGVFLRIAIPLAIGGLVATAILVFLFTWNEYFFASILTQSDAKPFTVHLPSYFGNRRLRWGPLSAASLMGAIVPVTLAWIARRYLVEGFTFGTVRGRR
jgi:multiple sugar transport system permease protein